MILTGISDEAGKDILTQIKAHKDLGWGTLELRLHNGANASTPRCSDGEFNVIRNALEQHGMGISCFASAIGNWSRNIRGDFSIDVADLKLAAKRMKQVGTRYIRIMTWVPDETDWPYTRKEAIRRCRELAKIAEEEDILIAHENCTGWGGMTADNMVELKTEVDSPCFVLLYDTGNVPAYGMDPWAFFQGIRGHFEYIHIKDARINRGQGQQFAFVGEGEGMISEILKAAVREDGYNGILSIEPHIASIVHQDSNQQDSILMYETYLKYGRMLEELVRRI